MPIDDTEEEALQHTAWEELSKPSVDFVQQLTVKYDSRTYEALVSGRWDGRWESFFSNSEKVCCIKKDFAACDVDVPAEHILFCPTVLLVYP